MTALEGTCDVQGSAPEVRIAEAWADFARVLSIYPETNVRVRAGLDEFLETLNDATQRQDDKSRGEPADGIALHFREDALLCPEGEMPFRATGRLGWLQSRLDRSGLAGVRFFPSVSTAALVALSRQLLGNFVRRRSQLSFETLWPETYPGVELLARRFDGDFGGVKGGGASPAAHASGVGAAHVDATSAEEPGDELLDQMLQDPDIRSHLARLSAADADAFPQSEAERHSAHEMLRRVLRSLPAEAFGGFEEVIASTRAVLDAACAATATEADAAGLALHGNGSLATLLERVSRTHFLRQGPGTERLPVSRAKEAVRVAEQQRERDILISDDVDMFLAELEQLPMQPTVGLRRGDGESKAEQLAVCLHYVTQLDRLDEIQALAPALQGILEEAGQPELEILLRHLESNGPEGDVSPWNPRVVDFLERTGNMRMLLACGAFTADRAVANFPTYFATYLQALDLKDRSVQSELRDVCGRIGNARLVGSAGSLVSEMSRLTPETARAIAECADRSMLGLIRLLLSAHPIATLAPAARILRALDLPGEEREPLRHIGGVHHLTSAYLVALCEQHLGIGSVVHTEAAASQVLCRHVRATRIPDPKVPVRLASIRALAQFRSIEGEVLLRELCAGKWFGLGAAEPRAVRRLAATVLKEIKAA